MSQRLNERQAAQALRELREREMEGLRLFRPMPPEVPSNQEDFLLRGDIPERVYRGGNQAGKTTICAAEVASAATGIPITLWDGRQVPFRYAKAPIQIWVTGYNADHVGITIFPKLFKPGAFDIIKDKKTGLYRAWRPWDPEDMAREDEKELAPPLIPPRMCDPDKDIAYEDKKKQVFSVARLKNGTEIWAFPSGGQAPQGQAVHLIWIDEDILIPAHVQEWRIRQGKVKGKFIWSAWPHTANNALRKMTERSEKQKQLDKPDIREWMCAYEDNPYIDADSRRRILEGMSEEERRARNYGEYVTDTILVYPSFREWKHCMPTESEKKIRIETFLADNDWQIPQTWTRYMAIDSGHTQPAVLMGAVPPPAEFGDYLIIYNEVYIPRITAGELADEIDRVAPGEQWESFIIDQQHGLQTTIRGDKHWQIYADEFARVGLKSRQTSNAFEFGHNKVAVRNMIVREWLNDRGQEKGPRLLFLKDRVPFTIREFALYKKRIVKDTVFDDVVSGHDDHAMDALAYMVAKSPTYVQPQLDQPLEKDKAYQQFLKLEKLTEPKETDTVYMGAGAAPHFSETEHFALY